MLSGLTVAVIGGDARQLEIIRKLSQQHAKVFWLDLTSWIMDLSVLKS